MTFKDDLSKIGSFLARVIRAFRFLAPSLLLVSVWIGLFFGGMLALVLTTRSDCEFDAVTDVSVCSTVTLTGLTFIENAAIIAAVMYVVAAALILLYRRLFVRTFLKS